MIKKTIVKNKLKYFIEIDLSFPIWGSKAKLWFFFLSILIFFINFFSYF